jgi:hypothetical protein
MDNGEQAHSSQHVASATHVRVCVSGLGALASLLRELFNINNSNCGQLVKMNRLVI